MIDQSKFWERPNWLFCLLLPFLHFASIRLTYLWAVTPENVVVFWVPNAVLLAAILRFRGQRALLLAALTFTSDVLANLHALPLHVALMLGIVNQGEVLLTFWLLMRSGASPRLHRIQDFLKFSLTGPVLVSMAAGMTAAAVLHHVAGFKAPYFTLARLWWFSDGLGMFIFTPLLLAFTLRQPRLRLARIDIAILGGALLMTAAVLSAQGGVIDGVSVTPTLLLPVVALIALRYGARLTTLFVAVVSMATALMMTSGMKPFGDVPVHLGVVRTQEFILTLCMIGIGFAVLINEVRARERELEERVRERTRE
ncbi:MAG: MASE1 domain-containing protein, partial [Duganella sp.]